MKIGKVSENVLKRSILKQIKTKRKEVLNGAGVGEDCAILAFEKENFAAATQALVIENGRGVRHGVMRAVNSLAAGGAEPVGITVAFLLPETIEESEIKVLMQETDSVCSELNIQILGGHTEVTKAVSKPVITVTGVGKLMAEGAVCSAGRLMTEVSSCSAGKKPAAGLDIVVTKWVGLEGTAILAKEKEQELRTKYPSHLVEEAKGFEKYLPILPEAATAVKSGVYKMHDASEGGIFGALWELAECLGVGLEIDLKKLPIRQETIEVCEYFDLNPYELLSGGSLLLATEKGFDLVRALEKEHIPAAVVGKTTENNDRVVINEEERRFLEPRKTDEIHKVKF